MNKRNGLPGADAADVFEQKIGRTDMQELEKILEERDKEIAKERAICEDLEDTPGWKLYEKTMNRAKDIIRKHMNDGWIPCEKRMPDKEEYCGGDSRGIPWLKRLEIAYMTDTVEYIHGYYDGYKWMDKYLDAIKNVVAWRIHEPYRPERRKDGQAD